jgi:hypothetical protein
MKFMTTMIIIGLATVQAWGHPTYTGYSGSPGRRACSISCHHRYDFTPTITVTGFPESYVPGQQYTIALGHSGGSTIANFNCSIRIGTGTSNAGTITAGTNTSTYNTSGETNGVHFSSPFQDSGNFHWTAPSSGSGEVRLYLATLQGNLSNGADTQVVIVSNENTTGINDGPPIPITMSLAQNYPNPFNAETIINFNLAQPGHFDLLICNIIGQRVYGWSDDIDQAGTVSLLWDGKSNDGLDLPSGVYFYQLRTSNGSLTRQMVLLR